MNALLRLYRLMTRRRRRQLLLTLAVMLAGAFAELVTIGAALPFLVLLSGVQATHLPPRLSAWLEAAGTDTVVAASLLLIAAAAMAAAMRMLLAWSNQSFVASLGRDMAMRIYSRSLRQPYAAFVRQNSVEVLSGIAKVQMLAVHLMHPALQGAVAAVLALCITAMLLFIDPLVAGVVALAVTLAYGGFTLATRGRLRRNSMVLGEATTARTKILQEGIGGIRDIILDQSQPVFEEQFGQIEGRLRRAQVVNSFIAVSPRFVIEAAGITAIAITALVMSRQEGGIVRALPVLGIMALGAQRLLPLLQQAYAGLSQSIGNRRSLDDVLALMEQPIQPVSPRRHVGPNEAFREALVFDRVGFEYGDAGFVLRDINLTIAQGSRVGIAGTTGSGKSTLLDLLMGLLDPTEGEIWIDGRRLEDDSRSLWQAQIAHVPQAIYLADDSIAANIAFAVKPADIDSERLRAAAEAAHLVSFIETLPDRYATKVGERGIRLSGGQRQRIGIARALYKGAGVLIFDEATSALDDDTEAAVIRSVMALSAEITLIMVAHRTSTLAGCDRIIRLEDGKLV